MTTGGSTRGRPRPTARLRLARPLQQFLFGVKGELGRWIILGSIKELLGYTLETIDGGEGAVNDFYFDDAWHVRYLVADTRKWVPGRLVLISPAAFIGPDRDAGVLGTLRGAIAARNAARGRQIALAGGVLVNRSGERVTKDPSLEARSP